MDDMGLNKNAPGIERILNRVVYRLFFRSACIDPLLDDFQLLCGQVGKVLACTLDLEQGTVLRVIGDDHRSILTAFHQSFISKHIETRCCQLTMTVPALCSQKWPHITLIGWVTG